MNTMLHNDIVIIKTGHFFQALYSSNVTAGKQYVLPLEQPFQKQTSYV